MKQSDFQTYIDRFNAQDGTAFDDYMSSDFSIINGGLQLDGIQGMKDHYQKIWPDFIETVNVLRYVSDDNSIGVHMWTNFVAKDDRDDSLFGPVAKGDMFDFRGVVMYALDRVGKFKTIHVAYNSFIRTNADGSTVNMGMPH